VYANANAAGTGTGINIQNQIYASQSSLSSKMGDI
jgi:hypothetical protein